MKSLIILTLCLALVGSNDRLLLRGEAAENPVSSSTFGGHLNPREQFLKHFITPSPSEETLDSVSPVDSQPATGVVSPSTEPSVAPRDFTSSLTTMLLSLALLSSFLLIGAYLVRHYFFRSTFQGRRGQQIRVLNRVNITPKATIALVEVPGKVLVVGITGQSLTTLSEIPRLEGREEQHHTTEPEEHAENLKEAGKGSPAEHSSFAVTLAQEIEGYDMGRKSQDEAILRVAEAIQKKVSGLKKL